MCACVMHVQNGTARASSNLGLALECAEDCLKATQLLLAVNAMARYSACQQTVTSYGCFTCVQLPGKATRLAWSHPAHGQLLAAGTSTGRVHIIQGPGGCSSKQPQQQALAGSKVEQQPQQSNEGWCSVTQLQCGNAAIRWAADAHRVSSLPPSL